MGAVPGVRRARCDGSPNAGRSARPTRGDRGPARRRAGRGGRLHLPAARTPSRGQHAPRPGDLGCARARAGSPDRPFCSSLAACTTRGAQRALRPRRQASRSGHLPAGQHEASEARYPPPVASLAARRPLGSPVGRWGALAAAAYPRALERSRVCEPPSREPSAREAMRRGSHLQAQRLLDAAWSSSDEGEELA